MPDDQVQFRSPTTGKVQAVPQDNWDEALKQGYVPTTHKVMYSPDGTRGMVPNSDLRDYIKQGYLTTPKTQFEQGVTGEGISLKGAGKAAYDTIKRILPEGPDTSSVSGFIFGHPKFDPESSGIVQAIGEAKSAAQRGDVPPEIAAVGSMLGVSAQQQAENATKGEGGKIIGETGVPAALAVAPLVGEAAKAARVPARVAGALRTEGGSGAIKPSVHTVSRLAGAGLGHMVGVPGLGELGGYSVGPGLAEMVIPKNAPPPVSELTGQFSKVSESPGPYKGPSSVRKGSLKPPPPSPFAGATSSATVTTGAPIPQGSPTPFQPISQGTMTKTAPYTEVPGITTPIKSAAQPVVAGTETVSPGRTSVLSRAKTPIELGVEPDMNNPAHVKMINDIIGQGLNESAINKLKVRARMGDRFAAVALDYWRSKTGR